ncbi:hypothetical protein ADK76_03755 [Streptomyces griseoflavus]|nr:hypothetical protein ADK76_03755 [Streptomyces griseoflavus]
MVTRIAVSVQNSLAIAASLENGWPASRRRAAVRYSERPASIWVAMSAIMKRRPWKSAIGRPNCCREAVYASASSRAAWATPIAQAAMPRRPESSADRAIAKPWPSSPIRRASGTRTPSKCSWAVGEPFMPILRSGAAAVRPSASPGTRKAVMPRGPLSPVRASTV